MSIRRSSITSWLLAVAFVGAVGARGAVALQQQDSTVRIDNGEIAIVVSKNDGSVTSMEFGGRELLAAQGVYLSGHAAGGQWNMGGSRFRVVRHEDDLVEVALSNVSNNAFRTDVHYVVRLGDPGFYCYVKHRLAEGVESGGIGQSRIAIRINPDIFDYKYVSRQIHGPLVSVADLQAGVEVMDATFRLPDGSIYTKYDWTNQISNHTVHGMTGQGVGIWVTQVSNEYLNGGPTKKYQTLHQTHTTPILLRLLVSGHFLPRDRAGAKLTADWEKLYGPVFIFANQGPSLEAMYEDAQRRAAREWDQWPYAWMEDPLYVHERGEVRGRLLVTDGSSAEGGFVILGRPDEDWQVQADDYLFWSEIGEDGRFAIPKIRPGRYTLYTFVPGVLGEYRQDEIVVEADAVVELPEISWTPPTHGEPLWQVGIPDRTAREYRHGGAPRQYGLFLRYPQEFPSGVNFIIGQSNEREDWNYVQPAYYDEEGNFIQPRWNILFDLDRRRSGEATLSIGTVGADGPTSVTVLVNGHPVGEIDVEGDSSIRRSETVAGFYELHRVRFDAGMLHAGRNTLSLQVRRRGGVPAEPVYAYPIAGVMYDSIRLEVAEH